MNYVSSRVYQFGQLLRMCLDRGKNAPIFRCHSGNCNLGYTIHNLHNPDYVCKDQDSTKMLNKI